MTTHISYGDLESLVIRTNKQSITKVFSTLEKKINKEYETNHKEEIKYLKQLIKKVTEDNPNTDLSIILGESEMTKEEKLETLNELLKQHKTFEIPLDFSIMIQDLPQTLQKLINTTPTNTTRVRVQTKVKKSKTVGQQLKDEQIIEQQVNATQVLSIEPHDFFVLLPFYQLTNEQSRILNEILDLDENLLPKKYTIFESFNTIIEKKHLTGEYFEYNVKQSDISKKFLEIEPSLQKVLFDFTKLNKKAIQKAREEMLELITVVRIIYDLKPNNYSLLADDVIKNIIRIYSNLIKNSKENPNIITYLTRSIQVLEHRRNKLHNEIKQLLKDDDKRKFLTKETAQIVQNQNSPRIIQQDIQPQDVEIGEAYTERFEEEQGFDDLDIVVEEESELLG